MTSPPMTSQLVRYLGVVRVRDVDRAVDRTMKLDDGRVVLRPSVASSGPFSRSHSWAVCGNRCKLSNLGEAAAVLRVVELRQDRLQVGAPVRHHALHAAVLLLIPHHETFSTTIQPPCSSTKG